MGQEQSTKTIRESSTQSKGLDEKFCESCGNIIKIKAEICPKCGVRQRGNVSKAALLLLPFFLGGIGGHKFYIGRNWQGFFYLIFCWTGIPSLIALVEFIIYAFTSSERLQEKYSSSGGGVVVAVIAAGIGFIFVVGILAAIAIPNFIAYRNRAHQFALKSELQKVLVAEVDYFATHNRYSNSLRDLQLDPVKENITVEIISADENCFQIKGKHSQLQEAITVDCNGFQ